MKKRKVLLVEDEPRIRDTIASGLRSRGYEVVDVERAEDGFDHVRDCDLLMLNLKLPGISGFEFLRVIREGLVNASVPVIVVSGLDDNETKRKVEEMEIVFFINKPFSMADVISKVERACGVKENIEGVEKATKWLNDFSARQEKMMRGDIQ